MTTTMANTSDGDKAPLALPPMLARVTPPTLQTPIKFKIPTTPLPPDTHRTQNRSIPPILPMHATNNENNGMISNELNHKIDNDVYTRDIDNGYNNSNQDQNPTNQDFP